MARNPFYERGVFNVDLRATKGFVCWNDHGIVLFGIGVYNLTNPVWTGSWICFDLRRFVVDSEEVAIMIQRDAEGPGSFPIVLGN